VTLTKNRLHIAEARFTDVQSGSQLFGCFRGDRLAPVLLRMAISDASASSKAILHALLALTSLHLKAETRAFAYQAKAVRLLSESLSQNHRTDVAFQNMAASMVLCTYQVRAISLSMIVIID
jgi:hypothetical protein